VAHNLTLLSQASASEVATHIRNREVSSMEVTEACLARIDALNSEYNVYITVLRDSALAVAKEADIKVRAGDDLGPLHGVPVSVKDAFLMRGTATTLASPALRDYAPSGQSDASCVERLRRAGAVILGKVNVGSGLAPYFGFTLVAPPRNPWRFTHTPGGSSSGSAVAVALGMGYASVGTDLGGSIRIPAALTGVVGLKPTYGLVSQYGDIFCMSRTLEHIGPLTRTVRDAALLLVVLAGQDPRDPTSVAREAPDYLRGMEDPIKRGNLRFGFVRSGGPVGAAPEVRACVEGGVRLLADDGGIVEDITLPAFDEEFWFRFGLLEEWELYDSHSGEERPYFSYLRARLSGIRRKLLDQSKTVADDIRRAYDDLFQDFDILVMPTAPVCAGPFDIRRVRWAGRERDVLDVQLCNTWMFNFTGHPAISLPCGFSEDGLPIGLQMVGRHFEEPLLLRAAARLEDGLGGFSMPDPAKLSEGIESARHSEQSEKHGNLP
jgi:aspartyl-tRNA(Asn)/glutamyl-tRNA(Gln) amidotransferase subunit A